MLARASPRLHHADVKTCMHRARRTRGREPAAGAGLEGFDRVHRTVADTRGHCPQRPVPRRVRVHCASPDRTAAMTASPPRTAASPRRLPAQLDAGTAVSGSELAERLGVSRAAVWKQVEQLRAAGLDIQAQAGSGYRLAAPLDLLDAAAIRARLAPATARRLGDIDVSWQIDSTSSELLRRAAAGARDRSVCLAERQSAGRGRRGRVWQMPLGGGLALSMFRRFDGAMASLAGLSLVAGLAAVDALARCGVDGIGLKWPNDLVARGAKLGGILVELGGDALGPCHAVIGIGINVHLGAAAAAIDQRAIDIATLGATPSRNALAAALIESLDAIVDTFARDGFSGFAERYARFDVLQGREVDLLRTSGVESGIARGVDARGALRVAFADGERSVDSGEVSVRTRA